MTTYIFKRPFRNIILIEAVDTLALRAECRKRIGWRKSARLRYKQIGGNTFRIENRFGLTVADVYREPYRHG